MNHLYKWINQYSDVFISAIDGDSITYTVRDKVTGVIMEPPRKTKYVVDEIKKMIYMDERSMHMDEFLWAFKVLNDQ